MKRILIIDDEQDLREGVAEILGFEGFYVLEASNGEEGIEIALQQKPDLILCDVMMPDMNGFEVLSHLRKEPQIAFTPFVFLTALAERNYQRKGIELGADDFLIKPFTRQELLNAINIKIRRSENLKEHAENSVNQIRQSIVKALPHEFRTALNAILGFSKIILEDASNLSAPELAEMGNLIHKSGTYLYEIITKYLLYIDIEINKPKQKYTFDQELQKLIEPIALETAEKYNRTNDLKLNLSPGKLNVLQNRFCFAIKELIDNAFKFSESGQPVVIATSTMPDWVVISIEDQGRGFPADSIDQINAFLQFERDIHEQQGIGLGLYLAKKIISLHHGSFSITSTAQTGTCIQLSIPLSVNH